MGQLPPLLTNDGPQDSFKIAAGSVLKGVMCSIGNAN